MRLLRYSACLALSLCVLFAVGCPLCPAGEGIPCAEQCAHVQRGESTHCPVDHVPGEQLSKTCQFGALVFQASGTPNPVLARPQEARPVPAAPLVKSASPETRSRWDLSTALCRLSTVLLLC